MRLLKGAVAVSSLALLLCLHGCADLRNHSERCTELTDKAEGFARAGDSNSAIATLKQAQKEAAESDNLLQAPRILEKLAGVYALEHRNAEAETCLTQAVQTYERLLQRAVKTADRTEVGDEQISTLVQLGDVELSLNKLEQAEAAYKSAWQESRKSLGSIRLTFEIYNKYVGVLRLRGKNKEADELEIMYQSEDTMGRNPRALLSESELLMINDKLSEAVKSLKALQLIYKQRKEVQKESIVDARLVMCEYFLGHESNAEKLAQTNLEKMRASHNAKGEARAQVMLSWFDGVTAGPPYPFHFDKAYALDEREAVYAILDIADSLRYHPVPRNIAISEKMHEIVLGSKREIIRSHADPMYYHATLTRYFWTLSMESKHAKAVAVIREILALPAVHISAENYYYYIKEMHKAGYNAEGKALALKVLSSEDSLADMRQSKFRADFIDSAKTVGVPDSALKSLSKAP